MITYFEPESVSKTKNSQNENLISLPTDSTTRNVKLFQMEGKWYQMEIEIYTKEWWTLETVIRWVNVFPQEKTAYIPTETCTWIFIFLSLQCETTQMSTNR